MQDATQLMDSLYVVNDSLNHLLHQTIIHQSILDPNSIYQFKQITPVTNNAWYDIKSPLWTLIVGLIISIVTIFIFNKFQKERDSIIETKKTLLEKRLDVHSEILRLLGNIKLQSNWIDEEKNLIYSIHKFTCSYDDYLELFKPLMVVLVQNRCFLSPDSYEKSLILTKVLQTYWVENKGLSDNELVNLSINNLNFFNDLISEFEDDVLNFFNNIEKEYGYSYEAISKSFNINDEIHTFKSKSNWRNHDKIII